MTKKISKVENYNSSIDLKLKEKNYRSIQLLIVFAIGVMVYFNTYFNKFALDDTMVLTENKYTKDGWNGIKKIFTSDAFEGFLGENKNLLPGGRYRPLSQMILSLEYNFFHLNAAPYHLINIILWGILLILLFKLLLQIFSEKLNTHKFFNLPFVVTVLYAVHPIHTEVVANIKSLDLLFAMLFAILSISQSILFFEDKKKIRLLYIFILLLLGIFSKENSITLLVAIPLIIIYFRFKPLNNNSINFSSLKPLLAITLSLVSSILSYFVLRAILLGKLPDVQVTELLNNPFLEATSMQRFATVIYTWFVYFKLLLFPIHLTHDYYPYVFGLKDISNPIVLLSLLGILIASFYSLKNLVLSMRGKSEFNVPAFGFMFFFTVFSASSNLFINIGAFMNERFVFIADIGLFIGFCWLIMEILPNKIKIPEKSIWIFFAIIMLLFSIKTYDRNKTWYDDYTLFTTDVKISSNSAKCNVSAGGKSYEKAMITEDSLQKIELLYQAVDYLNKGISIHPKYFQAYWLLGNTYFELNQYANAFETYKSALSLAKNKDVLQNLRNLAIKAKIHKDYHQALEIFNYLNIHRNDKEINYQIAEIYADQNKNDSAISLLLKSIKDNPNCDDCYNKLGEIYGKNLKRFDISRTYLLKAFEINPGNASVIENLGVLNGMIGNFQESLNFLLKALEIKPKDKNLLLNISLTYRNLKDFKNAEKYLELYRAN